MDAPLICKDFLNCYEMDELCQQEEHYPRWLENDDSDSIIYEDALYGVI